MDDIIEICVAGTANSSGAQRAAAIVTTFIPTETRSYSFTHKVDGLVGNSGITITAEDLTSAASADGSFANGTVTTILANTVFSTSDGADRINAPESERTYTVDLDAGVLYTFIAWTGGGSSTTQHCVSSNAFNLIESVTASVINPVPESARRFITISNTGQNGFGITNYLFHLSDDPSVVGNLSGQTLTFTINQPRDFYLVGPSTAGVPSDGDFQHNGTVNGIHFTATWNGIEFVYEIQEIVRHHPGDADWNTRSYDSVVTAHTSDLTIAPENQHFNRLFENQQPVTIEPDQQPLYELIVYRQDLTGTGATTNLFADDFAEQGSFDVDNPDPSTAGKYSTLDDLEKHRLPSGKFRFKLEYPDVGITLIFEQTSNPYSGQEDSVEGFELLEAIGHPATGFDGLSYQTGANLSAIQGNANHENWWYGIVATELFGGGLPAAETPNVFAKVAQLSVITEYVEEPVATSGVGKAAPRRASFAIQSVRQPVRQPTFKPDVVEKPKPQIVESIIEEFEDDISPELELIDPFTIVMRIINAGKKEEEFVFDTKPDIVGSTVTIKDDINTKSTAAVVRVTALRTNSIKTGYTV